MQMPDVQVHRPGSLKEACDLIQRLGEGARLLAGGTDLLCDLKMDRATGVEHLVSIGGVPGLDAIADVDGGLHIGARVTPNRLAADRRVRSRFPALAEAAATMGSYPIRNMATIGGNVSSAVPCSDLAPNLLALGATAVLVCSGGTRRVALSDFFLGPRKSVRRRDEILTWLELPAPAERSGCAYQRFSLRGANAVGVASVAVMLRLTKDGRIAEARVILGAVAPIPDLARRTVAFLVDKKPSPDVFAEAGRIAREEARPISDVRGSKEYRRELVEVLTARALAQAAQRGAE